MDARGRMFLWRQNTRKGEGHCELCVENKADHFDAKEGDQASHVVRLGHADKSALSVEDLSS